MGHNINFNEQTGQHSFFSVQKKAWHDLGQVVEGYPTSKEALELAGLDYEVIKAPNIHRIENGAETTSLTSFFTYRKDNSVILGDHVGTDYKVVQNVDAFSFFDSIVGGDCTIVHLHDIDSLLTPNSPVRRDINKSLVAKPKSFLGMSLKNVIDKETKSAGADKVVANAKGKVDKAAKKRGLVSRHSENKGKSYIDLFYQDWFAGRYEVKKNEPLSKQIGQQDKLANTSNFNSVTSNELGHPSLFSQYKTLNKQKKDKEDTKGEIGVTTNMSTGQEQYSGVDNNFYELRGRLETQVSGIPIEIEGLYTSQDNHRQVKSSYFRVHYDIEKMKESLSHSVSSYNSKFAETKSKNVGMQAVYATSLSNLQGQRNRLQNELSEAGAGRKATGNNNIQKGITDDLQSQSKDTTGLGQSIAVQGSDSNNKTGDAAGKAATVKETSVEDQKKIEEKRKKVEALDKKIEKLQTLLAQNQNTNHFDSVLGYNKTKGITGQSDVSYKQMAKRSTNMLPDGQAKGFITGVTNMDAGMFPKNESKYTMAGQMMKGLDFGYDFGFCEAGITLGKTEYVGRDGNLDKYTCYSEKTTFKPVQNQKIALVYYGYTPDNAVYSGDGFFKNASIAAPGFFQPVHIISLNYSGSISKYVTVGGEAATSIKRSDNTDSPAPSTQDKMAYDLNANGNIPNTAISLEGSYNKTGKNFENNTLPVTLSGTEQYRLAGKNDFFRSLVTLGIDYNYLIQSNFSSKSSSTKWGFDVRTNFKRYPNVALSYKPFTTFRSYTDTLSVPQRPLLGSVWTAKATWQIKKQGRSLRFLALYNKSITTMDTARYGNRVMQFSTIYTDKVLSGSVTAGYSQMTGPAVATTTSGPADMLFLSLGASYMLSKKLSVTGGQDFGIAGFGFCKYGINGGFMYRPEKMPVTFRVNLRGTTYELNAAEKWKQLYGGNIDVLYKFKLKNDKKAF
jgi:hypothetical protein